VSESPQQATTSRPTSSAGTTRARSRPAKSRAGLAVEVESPPAEFLSSGQGEVAGEAQTVVETEVTPARRRYSSGGRRSPATTEVSAGEAPASDVTSNERNEAADATPLTEPVTVPTKRAPRRRKQATPAVLETPTGETTDEPPASRATGALSRAGEGEPTSDTTNEVTATPPQDASRPKRRSRGSNVETPTEETLEIGAPPVAEAVFPSAAEPPTVASTMDRAPVTQRATRRRSVPRPVVTGSGEPVSSPPTVSVDGTPSLLSPAPAEQGSDGRVTAGGVVGSVVETPEATGRERRIPRPTIVRRPFRQTPRATEEPAAVAPADTASADAAAITAAATPPSAVEDRSNGDPRDRRRRRRRRGRGEGQGEAREVRGARVAPEARPSEPRLRERDERALRGGLRGGWDTARTTSLVRTIGRAHSGAGTTVYRALGKTPEEVQRLQEQYRQGGWSVGRQVSGEIYRTLGRSAGSATPSSGGGGRGGHGRSGGSREEGSVPQNQGGRRRRRRRGGPGK
jgi:hypothetical protein